MRPVSATAVIAISLAATPAWALTEQQKRILLLGASLTSAQQWCSKYNVSGLQIDGLLARFSILTTDPEALQIIQEANQRHHFEFSNDPNRDAIYGVIQGLVFLASNASALTLECTFTDGKKAYEALDGNSQVTADQFIQDAAGSDVVISKHTGAVTRVGAANTNNLRLPVLSDGPMLGAQPPAPGTSPQDTQSPLQTPPPRARYLQGY